MTITAQSCLAIIRGFKNSCLSTCTHLMHLWQWRRKPKKQSSGMGSSTIAQNEILSRFGENVYTHAYTAHNISCPNNETTESNNSTMAKHQLSGPEFYFLGCPHGITARRKHNRWYHIASLQSPCNEPLLDLCEPALTQSTACTTMGKSAHERGLKLARHLCSLSGCKSL